MTDLSPTAFPKPGEPVDVRRRKALSLTNMPKDIVSGPALRLAGARVLFELGDIDRADLRRYEREAAD